MPFPVEGVGNAGLPFFLRQGGSVEERSYRGGVGQCLGCWIGISEQKVCLPSC